MESIDLVRGEGWIQRSTNYLFEWRRLYGSPQKRVPPTAETLAPMGDLDQKVTSKQSRACARGPTTHRVKEARDGTSN